LPAGKISAINIFENSQRIILIRVKLKIFECDLMSTNEKNSIFVNKKLNTHF